MRQNHLFWSNFSQNFFSLTLIYLLGFQPCRGGYKEVQLSTSSKLGQVNVGGNSTRILLEPSEKNFVNFFPTVEGKSFFIFATNLLVSRLTWGSAGANLASKVSVTTANLSFITISSHTPDGAAKLPKSAIKRAFETAGKLQFD
jgi:hypothetical protein